MQIVKKKKKKEALLVLTFIMLYWHPIKIWSAYQNQAVSGSIILGVFFHLCFFLLLFFPLSMGLCNYLSLNHLSPCSVITASYAEPRHFHPRSFISSLAYMLFLSIAMLQNSTENWKRSWFSWRSASFHFSQKICNRHLFILCVCVCNDNSDWITLGQKWQRRRKKKKAITSVQYCVRKHTGG